MILSIVACISSIAGIIGWSLGFLPLLFVGAAADIADNINGVASGQQKTLAPLFAFGIAGLIIGLLCGAPWWLGLCVGLCAESIVVSLLSLIMILVVSKKM